MARHPRPEIDPIPIRPPNYFAHAHGPAEIKEENRLAKASVIRAPRDLDYLDLTEARVRDAGKPRLTHAEVKKRYGLK